MKSTFHRNQSAPKPLRQMAGHWRSIIVIAIFLSVLAAFTGYLLRHDDGEAEKPTLRHTVTTHPDRSTRIRSKTERIHEWQWPTEGKSTYQIKQSLDLTPGNSSVAPDACGRTEIEGKLNVCFVDADAQGVTLAMQLSEIAVTIDPAGDKAPDRQPVIESMLNSSPGLLHLGRDGQVLSCELPAALADEDRAMLQGLFATEFVLGVGTRWEADEKVRGFAYHSTYRTETGARVSKTRQTIEAPKGQPSVRILKSGFTAVPGPFWIESLEGAEQIEYIWQDQIICTVNTSVKLSRLVETMIPDSLTALIWDPAKREALIDSASLLSMDKSTQASARERQKMAQLVEKYQTVPAEQMIEDLVKIVASGKDHAATVPAMHALRDWLLANPARSAEIAEALKKPELQGPVAARMAHALELAGQTSKESQTALASIIASAPGTFHPSVLLQATVAAGGVGRVLSPELLHALSDLAAAENPSPDYQNSDAAFFAMGALARDNPELQQSLVDNLSPLLSVDGNNPPEDIITALRTFGNTGIQDPAITEKTRKLSLQHQDENVRKAAADTLATLIR